MKKRKPYISILITANNHAKKLKKCIDSFIPIKNCEIVIVNNFVNEEQIMKETQKVINSFLKKNDNIVFYQASDAINKNKARNLAMELANGFWFYFVEDFDYASHKLINLFNNFKFNISNHFYRLPIYSLNKKIRKKKESIGLFKSKYFSSNASSLILNGEWLNEIGLRWEDSIVIDDVVPFLVRLYNYKNVNYEYIKRIRTVYHNFNYESNLVNYDINLVHLNNTFDWIISNKQNHYWRQFAILMLYNFYKLSSKQSKKQMISAMKKKVRSNIFLISYWFLGPKLWFKTLIMKYRLLF